MHPKVRNLSRVIDVVKGICCVSWLPGKEEKFGPYPRLATWIRPLLCVTEVTQEGKIEFMASISRPVDGKLHYRPIKELRRSISGIWSGNGVIDGVIYDHLDALARWATHQIRYPQPLPQPAWPTMLATKVFDGKTFSRLEDLQPEAAAGEISAGKVYEDFSPVLNARYWNPAKLLSRPINPAAEILGKRKMLAGGLLSYAEQTENAEAMISELVNAMREQIPLSQRYTDNELLAALDKPNSFLPAKNWVEFVDNNPDAVLNAMKSLLKISVVSACEAQDLMAAAYNPRDPLVVAYRSELQIVEASALETIPEFYSGNVLPHLVPVSQPRPVSSPTPVAENRTVEDDMEPVTSTVVPMGDVIAAGDVIS